MGTLEDLLKDYGLSEQTPAQEKTAAAAQAPAQKDEIQEVLEALEVGNADDGVTKVASETDNKGDNRMSLTGIYEELFGEQTAPEVTEQTEEGTEKVASEENAEEGVNEATQLFGELTAHYFGVAQGEFMDKIAGDLESEANGQDDEQPMAGLTNNAKPADPAMPVNHAASGNHGKASDGTGETTHYSLKEKALAKQILKRMAVAPVGAFKD